MTVGGAVEGNGPLMTFCLSLPPGDSPGRPYVHLLLPDRPPPHHPGRQVRPSASFSFSTFHPLIC